MLACIAAEPGRRAPDFAERFGREVQPFKRDVRKLKELGLTISLLVGYKLSPRGEAYRRATFSARATAASSTERRARPLRHNGDRAGGWCARSDRTR